MNVRTTFAFFLVPAGALALAFSSTSFAFQADLLAMAQPTMENVLLSIIGTVALFGGLVLLLGFPDPAR